MKGSETTMTESSASFTPTTDPHEGEQSLRRLRFADGHLGWFTTKYSTCRAIMGDRRFSQRPLRPLGGDDGGFAEALSGPESVGDLLRIDPPEHTSLRQKLARFFTVEQVQARRPAIERIVGERLDAMEEAGSPVDFASVFALPVPSMALCHFLGLPEDEREGFEGPTAILDETFETTLEEKKAAMADFYDFAWKAILDKRVNPGDDVLSHLAVEEDLSEEQLKGITFLLLTAGHHTTATMFGAAVIFLLADRERWELARAAPIENTVEELLRYLMTVNIDMPRTALEDVEIDGVVIKAGECVAVVPGRPGGDLSSCPGFHRFDPEHQVRGQHIAFGHGRHICLGQHLARIELQIGLERLMERFPTLHLAAPVEEIAWYRPWTCNFNFEVEVEKDPLPVAW
jgi:cytochrome P450